MNWGTFKYQRDAIEQLVKSVGALIELEASNKICIFQSPTGSGKTVMLAKFIEDIIKELPETDLCFVWVSIGKGDLQKQSKRTLEKVFNGSPKCVLVEEAFFGSRNIIERNEVVVVNWEKLRNRDRETGEWKSKAMKEGDGFSFIDVVTATKNKRKIILIIDESHYASDSERTNELRTIINADVTLEMSATPKLFEEQLIAFRTMDSPVFFNNKSSCFIWVKPNDVIDAGMIKKEITVNEGLSLFAKDETDSRQLILEAAYQKRIELQNLFRAEDSEINPLCLIQLPNADRGEHLAEIVKQFFSTKGITESNGKLGIWLSQHKSDFLDEINEPENVIEFLLFKQAIDTGWDCPRAHILLKLREPGNETFEIQTVGRILRMPEQKHYQNEKLNKGVVFINSIDLDVKREEYYPNIIKNLTSGRTLTYKPLQLISYFKKRVDYGDITGTFAPLLAKVFCSEFGIEERPDFINIAKNTEKLIAKGVSLKSEPINQSIIVDKILNSVDFDSLDDANLKDDILKLVSHLSEDDIEITFNLIIRKNLNGFSPKHSSSAVRGAIYKWFKEYLGFNYQAINGILTIQSLFLNTKNVETFSKLLAKATGEYKPMKKEEVKKKVELSEEWYNFEVNKEEFFSKYTEEKFESSLSVMQPCFLKIQRSDPEKEFEKYLETKADKIEWWYKNGVSKKDYFGIKYLENDLPQIFYPDYIIQLKSGYVGIFDPKKGRTAEDAGSRSEALQKYIKEQNERGKKLTGGILVQDATSKWRINQNNTYNYDPNNLTNWNFLEL